AGADARRAGLAGRGAPRVRLPDCRHPRSRPGDRGRRPAGDHGGERGGGGGGAGARRRARADAPPPPAAGLAGPRHGGGPGRPMTAFGHAPFIVIWETTRACALACVHCRAQAIPHRHPGELTTEEGGRLIDRVAAFGDPPPLLVLTGGDPMRRPDLVELVGHARRRGVVVSLTPSGTGAATEERLRALRDAGLARLAVSLDGATAEAHDAFRGVRGSHRHTMLILERARR